MKKLNQPKVKIVTPWGSIEIYDASAYKLLILGMATGTGFGTALAAMPVIKAMFLAVFA